MQNGKRIKFETFLCVIFSVRTLKATFKIRIKKLPTNS